jgi:UDP-N-acetylglucosamine 2-epimerase (non-hydrolysing)
VEPGQFSAIASLNHSLQALATSHTMKISLILGTRPEAIKLAPVILALRRDPRFSTQVCVTAQHRQMLDQVLEVFDIVPDRDLNLMRPGQTLPDLTCRALTGVSKYLEAERPDLVLVQGDTTTVFATALAAFYQEIPIGHVEAGLRTWNLKAPWPEEANRVLAGHLATLHFAPTETSRNNLLREAIDPKSIFVTGNTVIDALFLAVERVRRAPPEIPQLDSEVMTRRDTPLVLITAHRRESFGEKFDSICQAIADLGTRFPQTHFVYPVHLNPNVRQSVAKVLTPQTGNGRGLKNIHLIEPLPYFPFVALMERATILLTDSGGVQEEGPSLGKPILVMRETTERPEAVAAGCAKLVGPDRQKIVGEVSRLLTDPAYYRSAVKPHNPYGDGKAAGRILQAISDYFGLRSAPSEDGGANDQTEPAFPGNRQ